MNEAKAREIHRAKDLSLYTHKELQECDQWLKAYALAKFKAYMKRWKLPPALRKYTEDCVRWHFGAAETDELLQKCKCYPDWLT